MQVLPVIFRELREEARRPVNIWIRLLAGAALPLVLWIAFPKVEGNRGMAGPLLFGYLNATLFVSLWVMIPLLTADCLSREKREGTLGLLFLTPLNAISVVLGKCFGHGLRALVIFLSMLPGLLVPLTLGGVTWQEGLIAIVLDLSALALAFSAGLIASALCQKWINAVIVAELVSLILGWYFMSQHYNAYRELANRWVSKKVVATSNNPWTWSNPRTLDYSHGSFTQGLKLLYFNTDFPVSKTVQSWNNIRVQVTEEFDLGWRDLFLYPPGFWREWLWLMGRLLAEVMAVALGIVWLSAIQVRNSWRVQPPSTRQEELQKKLFRPIVWTAFFKRRTRKRLGWNPIAWLEQYSWTARATKMGWFFVVMCVESILLGEDPSVLRDNQPFVAILLAAGLAFSSVNSFNREKQTGAMELLLVTPLSSGSLIGGRIWGLFQQFLPALVGLYSAWIYILTWKVVNPWIFYQNNTAPAFQWGMVECGALFVLIPFVGFYLAMTRLPFLFSWLLTFAGSMLVVRFFLVDLSGFPVILILALLLMLMLDWRLKRRSFLGREAAAAAR